MPRRKVAEGEKGAKKETKETSEKVTGLNVPYTVAFNMHVPSYGGQEELSPVPFRGTMGSRWMFNSGHFSSWQQGRGKG